MPKEVIDAVMLIVMSGNEAVVKKERDRNGKMIWVVVENIRRVAYKESK